MPTPTIATADALRPSTPRTSNHRTRRRVVRWAKRIALALAGGGVLAGMVLAWLPKPVVVDTAVARRAPLEVEVAEDGQTRVHERFVVAAPISGTLDRIALEAGSEVRRGDVIGHVRPPAAALLDPRSRDEAVARLTAAIAHRRVADTAIAKAAAARDQAVREADRARQLADRAAIPIAERDRLELAERVATADRAAADLDRSAAEAEVEAARAALGDGRGRDAPAAFPITSPVSGRVLKLVRDSAGPVTAGAPLLELGDPRALEVAIDLLSADAAKIAPGMAVTLDGWGGEHPLRGQVRLVEPSGFTRISALGVEEQRVKVIAALDDIPPSLGDGFRVEARIVLWRGDAIVVPLSAVFRDHDHWAVYTADAGIARLIHVGLGHRGRTDVEIASGLATGAMVILHPGDSVTDGVKLSIRH